MRWTNAGVLVSVCLHGGAAIAIALLPKPTAQHSSMVAVVDHKKKEEKKSEEKAKIEEPPPPPKPIAAPRPLPKANPPPTAPPPPAAAPPQAPRPAAAALAAMPDLGISMSGGTGPGIAVPAPQAAAAAQPTSKAVDAPKAAAPKPADDCTEEPIKPKPLGAVQPAYTEAARSAGVEGKVRVQLTVDETGAVSAASVMSGLGYGLDEAAVAAAKRMKFNPGTRCGRPVASRFVVSMRFALE
jgi:protein TonB